MKGCLAIALGVAKTWREALVPKVDVPPYPKQSHRAVYSPDGHTVVIKEWDAANSRFDKIETYWVRRKSALGALRS